MRKLIIILVVFTAVGIALAFGGRKAYRSWKTQRAVASAREALGKSDYKHAEIWLRKAVLADQSNIEAVRMMGELTELSQSPAALFWRQRLVNLEPFSATNRLLLARVAIALKDFSAARSALDGVTESGKLLADFYKLSAALAISTGNLPMAEEHLRRLLANDPTNAALQFSFATILLQRTDRGQSAAGLQMLENLRKNPSVRAETLRHLATHAIRQTNYSSAEPLVEELLQAPDSTFEDRLLHLDLLSKSKSPRILPTLRAYQQATTTNVFQIVKLSRWIAQTRNSTEALTWLQSLPLAIMTNLPVAVVVSEALAGSKNWSGLKEQTESQNWGDLDYYRLSFLAKALREQNLATASKTAWSKALKASENRLDRLQMLQRFASRWKWLNELEEVLWQIVNRFPSETQASENLSALLYLTGKTRTLLELFDYELKKKPESLEAMNNFAYVAMLLSPDDERPRRLARTVYEKDPKHPPFAATYAYSLHLQQKTAEALEAMEKLTPEQLENPSIASHYALILVHSGNNQKAKKYITLSAKARLLPEERLLLQKL